MWINRAFNPIRDALPVKVLKGPRQVGKTSVLLKLESYTPIFLDDAAVRIRAEEDPRLFLDGLPERVILDEAASAPALFPELKRRVDAYRRNRESEKPIDIWITGSNQTLLRTQVRESLAGRASYFDLNTLSISELGDLYSLDTLILRGGWPELYASPNLSHVHYLNDLISTFIENDIVSAAGIEKKAAFTKVLQLIAGRIGQLFNASDIATAVGVNFATVQSWVQVLEENGILRTLRPYFSNVSKRLIKSPKIYFEDVALATRMQGWTEYRPLFVSPLLGSFVENIAIGEFARFFINRGEEPRFNFVRSKEKVEIDLLVQLPNQRFLAVEIKSTPQDFTAAQIALLNSLDLNIVARWIVSPNAAPPFAQSRVVTLREISSELLKLL